MFGTGAEIEAAKAVVGLVQGLAARLGEARYLPAIIFHFGHCGGSFCPRAGY